MAHSPIRTCVGCGLRAPQAQQVRLVKDRSGRVQLDPQHKMPGRGAWIHPGKDCLAAARKYAGLAQRSLRGATGLAVALDQLEDREDGPWATTGKRVGS